MFSFYPKSNLTSVTLKTTVLKHTKIKKLLVTKPTVTDTYSSLAFFFSLSLLIVTGLLPLFTNPSFAADEAPDNTPATTINTKPAEITQDDYTLSPLCAPAKADEPQYPAKIDNKIHLQSDTADMSQDEITTFKGSVVVEQNDRRLTSDTAIYKKQQQDITAKGNARLVQQGLKVKGDSIQINLKTDQGEVKNARYYDSASRAQGVADKILIKNKKKIEMIDATYTTCDGESPDWELSATNITLNNATFQGSASNVVIKFQSVPFLYLPYLQFPLGNHRQSGFLFPSFASSDLNGFELAVPYYWNIHPQADATITPRFIENRGTQLGTEFRYLTKETEGQLNIEYLPDDSIAQIDRELFRWQHRHNLNGGWSSNVDINYVSDKDYLDDFGGDINNISKTHIERRADVQYDAKDWLFRGRVQGFQSLNNATEQIKRLPQLNLNSRQIIEPNTVNASYQSELVHFSHSNQAPIGNRFILQPSVSLPLTHPAAELTFLGSLHYTQYDLKRTEAGARDNPDRVVPILSIDSKVFFERDSSFFGTGYLHTLEPRLQYLYIPYRDQSHLPNFDSTAITTSYSQLFSESKFTGGDRITDANQITYGLTSRYISLESGAEVLVANLGQTFHFANDRLTASGNPVRRESWSDVELSLTFQPIQPLKIEGAWTRNQQTRQIDKRELKLQYKTDSEHIFNINHKFTRDSAETLEISTIWRLTPGWQLIARQHDDLRDNRELETVYGIQYDSCCWGIRLVNRRHYLGSSPTQPYENTLYLELELKGLSSFGQKKQIDTHLNRGILGYSE